MHPSAHSLSRRPGGRWLLILLLCLGLWLPAHAETRLHLSDEQPDVDAWPAVTMLADPRGTLGAEDVLLRASQFVRPTGPHANLGLRREAVWLRVPLDVPAKGDGRWLLDIDYPSLDRVDVYVVSDGLVVQRALLGDLQRFDARPMATRSHTVPLVLERGLEHEVLLRVETTSSMIVPLRFVKAGPFHAGESGVQMVQGMAAGIGLCLLMYALAHWVGGRESMFLYYAITIFGTTGFFYAYFGLAPQHLWPGQAWLTNNAAPLLVLVALGGGMLLTERILDVRELFPRVAAAAVAVAAVAWIVGALFLLGAVNYRTAHTVATVLGPMPMLLAVPMAWIRWRQGDIAAPYLFAGWGMYAVGVAVMAALLRGWVDSNFWTQHSFQAGSTFEMLMWLRVLGVRNEQARHRAERADREREVLQSMARTDALTGLPNRRGLQHELQGALREAGEARLLGVYVADLDGFKAVNDRLGHDAGDDLLVAVAQRLRSQLRQRDVVARLGGDEFVVLARDLPSEAVAWQIGRKLVDAFAKPFDIHGQPCRVGLTIGFALAPTDGVDEATLLKRADEAMYAGKQAGKATVLRGTELPSLVNT